LIKIFGLLAYRRINPPAAECQKLKGEPLVRLNKALILENTALAPSYYRMRLLAPEIAAEARPGQFIQLRVAEATCTDPLLPRPLSLFRIDRTAGEVAVIYKIVGQGTRILAGKMAGQTLELVGPLGNGFTVPETAVAVTLVAGGVGAPPLFGLAETLKAQRPTLAIDLFYGGRTRSDLLELEHWRALGVSVYPITEDGGYGAKGMVTDLLVVQLRQTPYDYLAACGPQPMLKAVQHLALQYQLAGELSLEAHMACGVGACLGCVLQTTQGYRRVCVDGPVFNLSEVKFDD
jgi:dihydroorotate dehydrogenase electron transfer subunit